MVCLRFSQPVIYVIAVNGTGLRSWIDMLGLPQAAEFI